MTAAKKGIFAPFAPLKDPVEVINVASSSIVTSIKLPSTLELSSSSSSSRTEVIRFSNVHFTYPSRPLEPVLNGLSFLIQRGRTVAIVRPSGSGKSTIVQLLLRFYDTNEGSVSVDGKDVKSYHMSTLRKRYGWVQQEAPLFADSIAYNIAYGTNDDTKRLLQNGD
jgi:ABC-type multidrug transport system fused ATPase/permease subunit